MEPYKLTDTWRLIVNPGGGYALQKRYWSKKNEKWSVWTSDKYFGKVDQALNAMADIMIQESDKSLPKALVEAADFLRMVKTDFVVPKL